MRETKSFSLVSGKEEGVGWGVSVIISLKEDCCYKTQFYSWNPNSRNHLYQKYKSKTDKSAKEWKKKHPRKMKETYKKYAASEKGKKRGEKFNEKHPTYRQEYWRTPNGREAINRSFSKWRGLGFIPLNEPFENCEGHHLNKGVGIYIPKQLHRSVHHNLWTGEGMETINKLALDYLYGENEKI